MQLIFVGIFAIRSIIFSISKCKKWKINKIIHFQYAMELTYQLSCVSSITWFFQMITQVWGLFMVCAKRSKYNVNKCGRVTIFMQLFIFFWQMVEKSWSVFHDNWILSRKPTIANIHSMWAFNLFKRNIDNKLNILMKCSVYNHSLTFIHNVDFYS